MKHLTIKNKIGKLGEDIAYKYLKNNGFVVLHKNYLEKTGEIDIICEKDDRLHFIEVKSRSLDYELQSKDLGNIIFSNVHPMKLKRMHKTIELYLLKYVSREIDWQIDVIGVYIDEKNKKARITRIENIC